MSFLAKIIIEDDEMNVLFCSYEFSQKIDHSGRVIEAVRSGLIHITIESTQNTNLTHWMLNPYEFKKGKVVFYKRDVMSSNKTLVFEDAVCVFYKEIFDAYNAVPMKTEIKISARILELNDAVHTEVWTSKKFT
ncbi:MAG: type VI secretion system tube protein TssD [Patiriisocius sp.]|uniref:type VI secretion system tube protein TssD n=1 Tax=Patiriisocius sp. TaxID=2822396 RepID=UPI003EF8F053